MAHMSAYNLGTFQRLCPAFFFSHDLSGVGDVAFSLMFKETKLVLSPQYLLIFTDSETSFDI